MSAKEFHGQVNEDGSATLLNRVCSLGGTGTAVRGEGKCLKQADVTSISYGIWDLSDDSVVVAAGTVLTVATVLLDTPTIGVGPIWIEDDTGYNFRHDLGPSSFPKGRRTYRYEAKLTMTSGEVQWLKWELEALEIRTS